MKNSILLLLHYCVEKQCIVVLITNENELNNVLRQCFTTSNHTKNMISSDE